MESSNGSHDKHLTYCHLCGENNVKMVHGMGSRGDREKCIRIRNRQKNVCQSKRRNVKRGKSTNKFDGICKIKKRGKYEQITRKSN